MSYEAFCIECNNVLWFGEDVSEAVSLWKEDPDHVLIFVVGEDGRVERELDPAVDPK